MPFLLLFFKAFKPSQPKRFVEMAKFKMYTADFVKHSICHLNVATSEKQKRGSHRPTSVPRDKNKRDKAKCPSYQSAGSLAPERPPPPGANQKSNS